MQYWAGWMLAVAGMGVVSLILGALWIYTSVCFSAQSQYSPVDPEGTRFPEEARGTLAKLQRALYGSGFNLAGIVEAHDALWGRGHRRKFMAVLENSRLRDVAILTVRMTHPWLGFGNRGAWHTLTASVEFWSEFEDGSVIETGNSWAIQAAAADEACDTLQVPEVADPQRLYEIHRGHVESARSYQRGVGKSWDEMTDPLQYAIMTRTRRQYAQLSQGKLRMEEESGVLYPTWQGAFQMAWEEFGPVAWIWRSQTRRRAEALLQAQHEELLDPVWRAQPA